MFTLMKDCFIQQVQVPAESVMDLMEFALRSQSISIETKKKKRIAQ